MDLNLPDINDIQNKLIITFTIFTFYFTSFVLPRVILQVFKLKDIRFLFINNYIYH
jgi:hypothetical protein